MALRSSLKFCLIPSHTCTQNLRPLTNLPTKTLHAMRPMKAVNRENVTQRRWRRAGIYHLITWQRCHDQMSTSLRIHLTVYCTAFVDGKSMNTHMFGYIYRKTAKKTALHTHCIRDTLMKSHSQFSFVRITDVACKGDS